MGKQRKTVNTVSGMQARFLRAYLLHGNATRAAREAGYKSPNKQGPRLAQEPKIIEAVRDYYRQQEMESVEVVARLSQQAKGLYAAYFVVDDEGRVSVDVAGMVGDGLGHLIKKVSWDKSGNQVIEFQDVQAALVHVGRSHALFRDGIEHGGAVPITFIEAVAPDAKNGDASADGTDNG